MIWLRDCFIGVGLQRGAMLFLAIVAAATPRRAVGAQDQTDVIQGRVTADSGPPLTGAQVIVTMAPDRVSRSTSTGGDGTYRLTWPGGTGDYLVHISADGRETFRRRVTRSGADSTFTVNAQLKSSVVQLARTYVRASRPKPVPGPEYGIATGAAERFADETYGTVTPGDRGSISALALTVPGVALTPGGLSVLGLPPSQNETTLNGMAFAGTVIPRDARTRTRVSTSTYDPARGGFSGMGVDIEMAPGGPFSLQNAHTVLDAPFLQASAPASEQLGERFTNLQLSAGGEGPIGETSFSFNGGVQAVHHTAPVPSLGLLSPTVLHSIGVAPDSVNRLRSILSQLAVPTRIGGIGQTRSDDRVSAILRIDRSPYADRTWGAIGFAELGRSDRVGYAPTAFETTNARLATSTLGVQGIYTAYFGHGYVTEAKMALTHRSYESTPYARVPSGNVLLGAVPSDGTLDGTLDGGWVLFGGATALASDTAAWRWEVTTETQLLTAGGHHLKLATQARMDRLGIGADWPDLGRYVFNTLQDVANNSPASFFRSAPSPSAHGGEWLGSMSVGDLWRVSPTLSLIYGMRADASRFVGGLPTNGAADSLFGVQTGYAPRGVDLSPRFGFTWSHAGGGLKGKASIAGSSIGRASGPTTTIRGGFGAFVGVLPADLLLGARRNDVRTIVCSGAAVPQPDWALYSSDVGSVPESCRAGAPLAFASSGKRVEFFGRDFSPSRSWRGNLTLLHRFAAFDMSVDGAYSVSPNQVSSIGLNFLGQQRFTLPGEAQRPVFVPVSSIVPASGVVSPVGSRPSADFGAVSERLADMRSVGRAATIALTRKSESGRFWLNGAYTLGSSSSKQRGFDGLTFGDPRLAEWARGDLDVRHQFRLYANWQLGEVVAFSLFGRVTSGLPFTPVVGSDINGDGMANDRAFVFRPGVMSDSLFDTQMRVVSTAAPSGVRHCLDTQTGRVAGRNSCEGPWTGSVDARVASAEGAFHLWHRMSLSLTFTNLLGAIDMATHGGNKLKGWGSYTIPDPVLYNVRGFDPVANRFVYSVNPRFGRSRTFGMDPFAVSVQASFTLGAPLPVQMLAKALNKGRASRPGPRLDAAALQKRYAGTVPHIYHMIISESDSLLLTREQIDTLQAAEEIYRHSADSAWASLASELAALGDHYDAAKALASAERVTDSVWALTQRQAPIIKRVLSPMQRRLLPGYVIYIITTDGPIKLRYYLSG